MIAGMTQPIPRSYIGITFTHSDIIPKLIPMLSSPFTIPTTKANAIPPTYTVGLSLNILWKKDTIINTTTAGYTIIMTGKVILSRVESPTFAIAP